MSDAKSLNGFLAAEAARDQGDDLLRDFVFRMLESVHLHKKRVHEEDTVRYVAESTPGLNMSRLLTDMQKPEYRDRIERDYREAADKQGIFGTPTLLFPGGEPVFVKMSPPAPREEARALFEEVRILSLNRPFIQELKKPRRPE